MTDAQFINESLLLENKIIGLKVNMERLRKFFEYAMRELCNRVSLLSAGHQSKLVTIGM